MTTPKKISTTTDGHEVIEFDGPEDIEVILKQIWPTGWIPSNELFTRFGINNPLVKNAFRNAMGLNVARYKVPDLADFIWDNSNYGKADASEE